MRRLVAVTSAVAIILALTTGTTLAVNPPGVTGTLNQHQNDISAGSALWDFHFALAQTFTPDVTGTLNAVGVYIGVTPPVTNGPAQKEVGPAATGDAEITVENVTGGVIGGVPVPVPTLGVDVVSVVGQTGWVYFEIPSPPSVVAGTTYAITLFGVGEDPVSFPDNLNWYGDCAPAANYPGGQALVFDGSAASPVWQTLPAWEATQPPDGTSCQQDFAFETYITAAPASTSTPPPTSTGSPATGSTDNGRATLLVIVAGFATAAAFVTMRRYGLARR